MVSNNDIVFTSYIVYLSFIFLVCKFEKEKKTLKKSFKKFKVLSLKSYFQLEPIKGSQTYKPPTCCKQLQLKILANLNDNCAIVLTGIPGHYNFF